MEELASLQRRTVARVLDTTIARGILSGRPDRRHYVGYLLNVFHYARHSARVIALAGSRAVEKHPDLASYYLEHAKEELGHERWALADLADLDVSEAAVLDSLPAPSCAAMIGLEYYTAGHGNPVALLGWMRVLESLGDELGHLVSEKIDRGLGGRDKASSFLRGHGDADREHIKEIDRQVAVHGAAPEDRREVILVATASADLYVRMLDESAAGGIPWA